MRELTPQEAAQVASDSGLSQYFSPTGNETSLNADNDVVFDDRSGRVLSLPQTLTASEAEFIISRDIDKKPLHFAQAEIKPVDFLAFPKGLARFAVSFPSDLVSGLAQEQVDKSMRPPTKFDAMEAKSINPFYLAKRGMSALGDSFWQNPSVMKFVEEMPKKNAAFIAKLGIDPQQDLPSKVMYDLGSGAGSLATSLAMMFLTKNPASSAALFGALSKSQTYLEAKAAGVDVDQASFLSNTAGLLEGGLEAVGLDMMFKGFKSSTFMKRFLVGSATEGGQETLQAIANEAVTQLGGIREKEISQTIQDVLYQGVLGAFLGGGTTATIGAFVKDEATARGLPESTAESLAAYANSVPFNQDEMLDFLEKEIDPLTQDDASAKEFYTLMQKALKGEIDISKDSLTPDQQILFDKFLDIFNNSIVQPESVAAVEQRFFEQARSAGVEENQAVAASKIVGMRADAAARALGVKPTEWFDSLNLELKRQERRAPNEMDKMLDMLRSGKQYPAPKKAARPLTNFIKNRGGIDPQSVIAGELRSRGITSKTHPGLYKKGGLGDIDNIPANELPAGISAPADGTYGQYADRDFLIDQLDNEITATVEDSRNARLEDLARQLDEMGLDIGMSNDEIIAAMNTDTVLNSDGELVDADGNVLFQSSLDQAVVDALNKKAVEFAGVTTNPKEAGFILTTGEMLDLSGRHEQGDRDYLRGQRQVDHREISNEVMDSSGTDGLNEFMIKSGAIRVDFNAGLIDANIPPNEVQMRKIISASKIAGLDYLRVEHSDKDGNIISNAVLEKINPKNIHSVFSGSMRGETLFQQAKNLRGQIQFGEKNIITLFETADASTLMHELAHLFLRDMRDIAAKTTRPMVKADYKKIEKFLGVKDGKFTVSQEEKFARAFEAHLMGGETTVTELKPVFEKFKDWLTSIYKSIQALNVKITPEISSVFDRMLGGDFARAENVIMERGRATVDADYAAVINQDDPESIFSKVMHPFAIGGGWANDAFVPVSTRLGNINSKMKHVVRRFLFDMNIRTKEDREAIQGFIKAMDKFEESDYKIFDLALKNRDTAMVNQMVEKYKIQDEFAAVKAKLDDIYARAIDAGMDVNYLEQYFPRAIRDDKAAEFLVFMRGQPEWGDIQEMLKQKDPDNVMDDKERAELVNNFMRGLPSHIVNLNKPSFTKDRLVDYVTPRMNQFYMSSSEALMNYVSGMNRGIETFKFLGKGDNVENSVGAYVLKLVDAGMIKQSQQEELKKILKFVVNPKGTNGFMSWMKDAGYIITMGSPISAITQLEDFSIAIYKNGILRTASNATAYMAGKSKITPQDLGLENILQEYESPSGLNDAVRLTFKAIGLEKMDAFGKSVQMSASYEKMQKEAKKGDKRFLDELDAIFDGEAARVRQELIDGKFTEDTKYMAFSRLADIQPIALSEMPLYYLNSGNGRIFYMLKTFTIKRLDLYRRDIFDNLASGERDRVIEGMGNLIRMAIAVMFMGMSTDALKDLIMSREFEPNDLFMDNIAKTIGFTRYDVMLAKREGIPSMILKKLVFPPLAPLVIVDDVRKDLQKGEDFNIKDTELAQRIPLVGKLYYWWWGGGYEKQND